MPRPRRSRTSIPIPPRHRSTRNERNRARRAEVPARTGWATFAGIVLLLSGTFNIVDGLAALFEDQVFAVTRNGLIVGDLTAWGWVHLFFGIFMALAGLGLFFGMRPQAVREFPDAMRDDGRMLREGFARSPREAPAEPAGDYEDDRLDSLERASLHERGALSDEEYEHEKTLVAAR